MSVNAVKFTLDSRQVPDGTILLFGIRYEPHPGSPLPANTKIYTYAMIMAGGFWYVTGGGKTPQAAGWGAIERWLERDGRVVEWVRHVTATAQLWPEPPRRTVGDGEDLSDSDQKRYRDEEPAEENCPHHPDDAGAGGCPFDSCSWCGGYHCAWDQSVHEGV